MDKQEIIEKMLTYKKTVFAICIGFSRTPEDAEELTQEIYLKAVKNLFKLKNPNLIKEWLYQITRRTCIDYTRREKLKNLFMAQNPPETIVNSTPEGTLIKRQEIQIVKVLIKKLPPKMREVIILREYGELTYDEMGILLKTAKGTITSRLNRARERLTLLFKEEIQNG
jgi:RNA polymerase sigma-70 factor (ECF subfamily)